MLRILLLLQLFITVAAAGEMITRSYPLRNCYCFTVYEHEYISVKKATLLAIDDKFIEKFKEAAIQSFITFPKGSSVLLDKKNSVLIMKNSLLNHFKMSNNASFSSIEAAQVQYHIELIEVINNSNLIRLKATEINGHLIRALPLKNKKTIAEFDLFTQNGSTAIVKSSGNTLEITPQVDPDGKGIGTEMLWEHQSKAHKTNLSIDTHFIAVDRGNVAMQVQASNGKNKRNLYLIISVVLVDEQLNPLPKFLKKDIIEAKKKETKEKPKKDSMGTRFYSISAGGHGDVDDDPEKSTDEQPSFKQYFINNGIPLSDKAKVTFVQTAMRLIVKAKESNLEKIEQLLKDIGIETPQAKFMARVVEIDSKLLAKYAPGKVDSKIIKSLPAKAVKVLENHECLVVSGSPFTIMDVEDMEKPKGFILESTLQVEPEYTVNIKLKLNYQRQGLKVLLEQNFSLMGDRENIAQIQQQNGKSYFLIISAELYTVETKFW